MVENEFENNSHGGESLKDTSSEGIKENELKQEAARLKDSSTTLFNTVKEKIGEENIDEKMKEAGHHSFDWKRIKRILLKGAALNI